MEQKKCSRCKTQKNITEFSKGQRSCKLCYREYYLKKVNRKCLECKAPCLGKRHMYCSNECKIIHNVIKKPNGCWEWQGCVLKSGYGATRDYEKKINSNIPAHRLSYKIFKGSIPENMLVCHACDNRKCCNPKHLWIGTHHDNNQDCLIKGRNSGGQPPGEKNPAHKLKEIEVYDIKKRLLNGEKPHYIAKIYKVKNSTIYFIRDNKTWKHVKVEN